MGLPASWRPDSRIREKDRAHQHRLRAGDSSGPGFEKYIAERLSNAMPDIKDLKRNVIIRDRGRKAWEIDVSFVLNKVLFIVEAKHYQKSLKYHAAEGSEVAERIQSWESECRERDRKLTTYQQHVRRKWDGSTLLGAICIICTEETEFVASAERKYWLNFPDIPRICTIDEFIEFLNDGGAKGVTDHPAFSRFREER